MKIYNERFEKFRMPLKFPKLKKLIINFHVYWAHKMIYIDFTSCTETLESLELHNLIYVCLKLGLERSYEENHFYDSLDEMRSLRNFTVFNPNLHFTSKMNLLSNLKSLR